MKRRLTRTRRPLHAGAFVALATALAPLTGASAPPVDTSQWKCESCPYETGLDGQVEAGVGRVRDANARSQHINGLENGRHLVLGGDLNWRGADGWYGSASGSELGLDSRLLGVRAGLEGRFKVRLGYETLPVRTSDGARTPFAGVGGSTLTLPAGFPAASTASMPLAGTLRPVDLGYDMARAGLDAEWIAHEAVALTTSVRHQTRSGRQRSAGSFFSNAAQLVAPVDDVADEVEVAAHYARDSANVTLAYTAAAYRNAVSSLTWSNPFDPLAAGATQGQLALPPDNQSHQLRLAAGLRFAPRTRASFDLSTGRLTQNDAYLPLTSNASLVTPGLPAPTLSGRVATVHVGAALSTALGDDWRLAASVNHDDRRHETPVALYPSVATDVFVGPSRSNVAPDFRQLRARLGADYRWGRHLTFAAGVDHDERERSAADFARTRESTLHARLGLRASDDVQMMLRGARAQRDLAEYRPALLAAPENPLLRRFDIADRRRDLIAVRADIAITEGVALGLDADAAYDDYPNSAIGVTDAQRTGWGADASAALAEHTRVRAYWRIERARSRQANSQGFAAPDWRGVQRDQFQLLGFGAWHSLADGKLVLEADVSRGSGSSDIDIENGTGIPFPASAGSLGTVRASATWQARSDLWLVAGFWYERYSVVDWRLDQLQPDTVANLLAFGEQAPRYRVKSLRLSLRHTF